ncbi:glutamate N-acetyltransferase/amino-acid N-acetyltransferase [Desulfitispora alkaliphila]|uniref:bifunctional ornithine acetyltransferase/N-acetylglutamate synthase n=1 Tax=Desulfitispora alkaliphila TaxID=622674 RepID=UPI003D242785
MNTSFKKIQGGVTAPNGFTATGVHCGIKKEKLDFAIVYSQEQAVAAGVYTTNAVQAAPILVTKKNMKENKMARAFVINAGNANACTGEKGYQDAEKMVALAAEKLGCAKDEIIVSSTGVIGVSLPMDAVEQGIEQASVNLSKEGSCKAAEAIMTTDTYSKEIAIEFELGGKLVKIGAMSKGSGMIHPNMATMLGFITTDADIDAFALEEAIKDATGNSFNMITVDGDTSTNDMVAIMANGTANNEKVTLDSLEYAKFYEALEYICVEMAKQIARDGEGATKLLEVEVKNAKTKEDAKKAAMAVVKSSLVKTAIFGEDANWGRIICAVGYSGAKFNPEKVDISIGDEPMAIDGTGLAFDEDRAKEILKEDHIKVFVNFKDGDQKATAWGCDLSYDYVKINGSYRT